MVKRVLGYGLACCLVLAGLLWPLVVVWASALPTSPTDDPVTVTSYQATYRVAADGRLDATETITARFPSGRHGIYRFWDVADPSDPGARHRPTLQGITLDGTAVPYETWWQTGDRYFVAKIGDPDRTLARGSHVYVITYSQPGAISPPTAGSGSFASSQGRPDGPTGSVLYWNVVAPGWQMEMDSVAVRVTVPSAATQVLCSAGTARGVPGPCTVAGAGATTVTMGATAVPPRSGMTARVSMAAAPPPRESLPWPVSWDKILGTSPERTLIVVVMSVGAFAAGLLWARSAREPAPGLPVMYGPPPGLGPVQTVYIDTETVGDHPVVATLLYMADRGLVALERRPDDSWLVTGRATPEQWQAFDPVTRSLGQSLGVTSPGHWFLADTSVSAGKILSDAASSLTHVALDWGTGSGYTEPSAWERWGVVAWLLAVVLAVVGFIGWLGGPTMYGLPFAAFVLGGLGLLRHGVGRRRTTTGREIWSKAGGFERLLSTPSAEERFDFAARKDLFIAYLPFAVAFGVADRWAEKYRLATGEQAPAPVWYPYSGGHALYGSGAGFDSFDGALSSAISTYQASQSSSSSGGGGGGFGGGGGGGGGGSW